MAIGWAAKAPTAVRDYLWTPRPGTAVDSATPVVTTGTATISATAADDTVTFTVTGGADGVTQIFSVTALSDGETLVETFYLPVEASTNRLGYTAREVCLFALRKVYGNGETPESEALADALERMNDILGFWRRTGADLGLPLPVLEATVLNIDDVGYTALKFTLRNVLHENYGVGASPMAMREELVAMAGLRAALYTPAIPEYM